MYDRDGIYPHRPAHQSGTYRRPCNKYRRVGGILYHRNPQGFCSIKKEKKECIFCVEDDDNIRELVIYTLETTGLEARGFADGTAFMEALAFDTPELVFA